MDTRMLEGVLLRCFIYGFVLLLFWFVLFLVAGGWIYDFHSSMFEITRHDFDMMNYNGMALVKGVVILFFLLPYLAVRFTPKNQKSAS
ncbi:MAG: DUF6868 family protein [Planctomycetota bacterium]|jgi:hypothetical protein